MSVTETSLYGLHSAVLVDADDAELVFDQLQGRDFDNGLRIEEYVAPGTVDRAISLLMEGNFGVMMRTNNLLGAMQGGVSFTTGYYAEGGATFRYQKRAPNVVSGTGTVGAFVTGANHKTKTSTGGMLMPVSLAVAQGQLASLTMAYFAFWTGDRSVLPLINNNGATLSNTPAHTASYTIGPVKYGTAFLNGLIGWELQTGLEFVPRLRDGLTYPVDGYLRMRMPRIILKFDTPDIQDQVGRLSHAALSSAITVYARRKSGTTGDGNVSDASSAHVSISAAAGSWKVDPTGVSDHDNAAGQVTILPTGTIATSYTAAIAA